jgi:hypothetical protein
VTWQFSHTFYFKKYSDKEIHLPSRTHFYSQSSRSCIVECYVQKAMTVCWGHIPLLHRFTIWHPVVPLDTQTCKIFSSFRNPCTNVLLNTKITYNLIPVKLVLCISHFHNPSAEEYFWYSSTFSVFQVGNFIEISPPKFCIFFLLPITATFPANHDLLPYQ